MTLAVGLIGAGYFAQFHAEAWARMPGARLAGVCDSDRAKAEATAARHGGVAFGDLAAMLAEIALDLLDIAAPPPVHFARGPVSRLPSLARIDKQPGPADPGRQPPRLARPGRNRRRPERPDLPLERQRRRVIGVEILDRKLHQQVEPQQRLVMGDVFLGLRRLEKRQVEPCGRIGHGNLGSGFGSGADASRGWQTNPSPTVRCPATGLAWAHRRAYDRPGDKARRQQGQQGKAGPEWEQRRFRC